MARGSLSVLYDSVALARSRRRFWPLPVLALLIILGLLLVAAQGSIIAPFIYTLF